MSGGILRPDYTYGYAYTTINVLCIINVLLIVLIYIIYCKRIMTY